MLWFKPNLRIIQGLKKAPSPKQKTGIAVKKEASAGVNDRLAVIS
jgi:hypothetical protein